MRGTRLASGSLYEDQPFRPYRHPDAGTITPGPRPPSPAVQAAVARKRAGRDARLERFAVLLAETGTVAGAAAAMRAEGIPCGNSTAQAYARELKRRETP